MTNTQTAHSKLGTDISRLHKLNEILARAGADYEVESHPMTILHPHTNEPLQTGKYFTHTKRPIKIENGQPTGGETVVLGTGLSSRYKPVSNIEILTLARDLAEGISPEAAASVAGTYRDLVVFFVQIPLEPLILPGGDTITRSIVASTAHDGSRSIQLAQCADRVFCGNQLSGIWRKSEDRISIRHSTSALMQPQAVFKEALNLTMTADEKFVAMAHRLGAKKLNFPGVRRVVDSLYPVSPDATDTVISKSIRRLDKIREYWEAESGAFGPNAWAGFNAVSSWLEHDKTVRGQSREERAVDDPVFARQIRAIAERFVSV